MFPRPKSERDWIDDRLFSWYTYGDNMRATTTTGSGRRGGHSEDDDDETAEVSKINSNGELSVRKVTFVGTVEHEFCDKPPARSSRSLLQASFKPIKDVFHKIGDKLTLISKNHKRNISKYIADLKAKTSSHKSQKVLSPNNMRQPKVLEYNAIQTKKDDSKIGFVVSVDSSEQVQKRRRFSIFSVLQPNQDNNATPVSLKEKDSQRELESVASRETLKSDKPLKPCLKVSKKRSEKEVLRKRAIISLKKSRSMSDNEDDESNHSSNNHLVRCLPPLQNVSSNTIDATNNNNNSNNNNNNNDDDDDGKENCRNIEEESFVCSNNETLNGEKVFQKQASKEEDQQINTNETKVATTDPNRSKSNSSSANLNVNVDFKTKLAKWSLGCSENKPPIPTVPANKSSAGVESKGVSHLVQLFDARASSNYVSKNIYFKETYNSVNVKDCIKYLDSVLFKNLQLPASKKLTAVSPNIKVLQGIQHLPNLQLKTTEHVEEIRAKVLNIKCDTLSNQQNHVSRTKENPHTSSNMDFSTKQICKKITRSQSARKTFRDFMKRAFRLKSASPAKLRNNQNENKKHEAESKKSKEMSTQTSRESISVFNEKDRVDVPFSKPIDPSFSLLKKVSINENTSENNKHRSAKCQQAHRNMLQEMQNIKLNKNASAVVRSQRSKSFTTNSDKTDDTSSQQTKCCTRKKLQNKSNYLLHKFLLNQSNSHNYTADNNQLEIEETNTNHPLSPFNLSPAPGRNQGSMWDRIYAWELRGQNNKTKKIKKDSQNHAKDSTVTCEEPAPVVATNDDQRANHPSLSETPLSEAAVSFISYNPKCDFLPPSAINKRNEDKNSNKIKKKMTTKLKETSKNCNTTYNKATKINRSPFPLLMKTETSMMSPENKRLNDFHSPYQKSQNKVHRLEFTGTNDNHSYNAYFPTCRNHIGCLNRNNISRRSTTFSSDVCNNFPITATAEMKENISINIKNKTTAASRSSAKVIKKLLTPSPMKRVEAQAKSILPQFISKQKKTPSLKDSIAKRKNLTTKKEAKPKREENPQINPKPLNGNKSKKPVGPVNSEVINVFDAVIDQLKDFKFKEHKLKSSLNRNDLNSSKEKIGRRSADSSDIYVTSLYNNSPVSGVNTNKRGVQSLIKVFEH
ncbi:hypothetical protein HELRODRAFT_192719 [Helobdella robusta]|uniref:Uncharacterized protein n=1 Tax=Helobdella robusta TaxID=6412 RepID=T1FU79_HELRO|nr:hypothetical protein HELRODRAFT_192719 [Helobdella robusta]ESO00067.1 hypothetical protein HELRODRAFT_192719 [Helobdella robusta]